MNCGTVCLRMCARHRGHSIVNDVGDDDNADAPKLRTSFCLCCLAEPASSGYCKVLGEVCCRVCCPLHIMMMMMMLTFHCAFDGGDDSNDDIDASRCND